MTKLEPKLEQLKEACSWEQRQLQAWQNETKENFGGGEQNEMKKLLNAAWFRYLDELQDSNKRVMQTCDQFEKGDIDKATAISLIKGAIDGDKEWKDVMQGIDDFLDSI